MKSALAGVLLMLLPTLAAGTPLFDARLKAKQTGDGIAVIVFIANRSHRSACYLFLTPDITTRYRDGSSDILISTNEPSWENGHPPPPPIRLVPADGSLRGYPWITLPVSSSAANSREAVSVETTVTLYDCRSMIRDRQAKDRKVFEETLTAPIEH